MNVVDTSPEKIAGEWEKIYIDFDLKEVVEPVEGEHIPGEASEGAPEITVLSPAEFEEKKAVTKQLISTGLTMAFAMLSVEDIPESITGDFADAWAVVIVKRFPDNPVMEFMDEYGDLISAGGATLVLIGAVRTSKSKAQIKQQIKNDMQKNVEGFDRGE